MRFFTAFQSFGYVLFFLSTCTPNAYSAITPPYPKIVIVGAGPAGIAAAVTLLENGIEDIVILEAEPRIGGRIHTIPFGNNVVDLGAEWCHGEKNNVVYEMVKDLNMLDSSMDIYSNSSLYRSNGEKIPEEIFHSFEDLMEIISSKRFNHTEPYNGSAFDFIKEEYYKALEKNDYKNIDRTLAGEFLELYEKGECSGEGCDNLKNLPLSGQNNICEGDQTLNWKDKGYKSFLNVLMKVHEFGKEYGMLNDYIRLSKKVVRIDWTHGNESKITITCEDGEEILANNVIVTVSLGVLKAQHKALFNPQLPAKKQAAIEKLSFGTFSKIFLEFDKKFWPEYWTGLSFLWTDEDLKTIRDTENFWWEGIVSMFAVKYKPLVFVFWIIGPSARHVETLDPNKVKGDCVKILKRFLKWDIPEPINIAVSNWQNNPNFRGGWTYHSIEMLESGISVNDLILPLTEAIAECSKSDGNNRENLCEKPIVLFAGEASNAEHYSTVHGAVETGFREGNRLAEFYKMMYFRDIKENLKSR